MRSRALPLAACASLLFLPEIFGVSTPAHAADLGGEVQVEDVTHEYDYGDAEYAAPNPLYYAIRGSVSVPDATSIATAGPSISTEYDAGTTISLAAGVDLEQMFDLTLMRLEIEGNYFHQSGGNGEVSGISGFVSLYRDLGEFYRFRPYAGVGIGVAHLSLEADPALDSDGNGLAFHLTTGVSMDWSETMVLDFGYRYTSIQDVEVTTGDGTTSDTDVNNHALFAGVRFRL